MEISETLVCNLYEIAYEWDILVHFIWRKVALVIVFEWEYFCEELGIETNL